MQGISIRATGGPEVLEWNELDDPEPGAGEVLVAVAAAGVNFIDVYFRRGLYPRELPFTPGQEGAGTVVALGPDVAGIKIGDRVAWVGPDSYADHAIVPAASAVKVPDDVPSELAAALMLQGLTAHYLATSTFPLQPGHRCLIHAGAGGVGLLLIQMAKARGAEVFTTVGTAEKGELAAGAGADHVIHYRREDLVDAVEKMAGPRQLDVVYDGVGADTFEQSLQLLRPRGLMVTFGNASGPVEPVSPLRLSQGGSLFLTRPTLGDYIATREELDERVTELFGWIADSALDVRIGHRFPMEDASSAHELLEGRGSTGKIILVP